MNIETFLKQTGQTVNSFAELHKIPATTVWRAKKGKVLRPSNALRIEKATGGAVTIRELLYPDNNNEKGADADTHATKVAT